MVFLINLEIHLNDSIQYDINIITYLIYLGNYVKLKQKLQVMLSQIEISALLTDELRNA